MRALAIVPNEEILNVPSFYQDYALEESEDLKL